MSGKPQFTDTATEKRYRSFEMALEVIAEGQVIDPAGYARDVLKAWSSYRNRFDRDFAEILGADDEIPR